MAKPEKDVKDLPENANEKAVENRHKDQEARKAEREVMKEARMAEREARKEAHKAKVEAHREEMKAKRDEDDEGEVEVETPEE